MRDHAVQGVARKAPPASDTHVLENFFKPELYQKNNEICSRWTRFTEESAFYEGTKVYMFEKSFAGLHAITYLSDKASLVHPDHLIAERVGLSWWVIKNGHACLYHHVVIRNLSVKLFL